MNARILTILDVGADGCFCRTCCDPRSAARVLPCRRVRSRPFRGTAAVRRARLDRFADRDLRRNPD